MMRRRRRVDRDEREDPTPETALKLTPDPLRALVEAKAIGTEEESAADEIRRVYLAVVRGVMARQFDPSRIGLGGRSEMPEWLAAAHAQTYVPWASRWSHDVQHVITLVVDREPMPALHTAVAVNLLRDYARRMGGRSSRVEVIHDGVGAA